MKQYDHMYLYNLIVVCVYFVWVNVEEVLLIYFYAYCSYCLPASLTQSRPVIPFLERENTAKSKDLSLFCYTWNWSCRDWMIIIESYSLNQLLVLRKRERGNNLWLYCNNMGACVCLFHSENIYRSLNRSSGIILCCWDFLIFILFRECFLCVWSWKMLTVVGFSVHSKVTSVKKSLVYVFYVCWSCCVVVWVMLHGLSSGDMVEVGFMLWRVFFFFFLDLKATLLSQFLLCSLFSSWYISEGCRIGFCIYCHCCYIFTRILLLFIYHWLSWWHASAAKDAVGFRLHWNKFEL